jgi:arylsulfatase A-like enzyme
LTSPNLFVLVIDSLRVDTLFGDRIRMPVMSRYANRGAAFTQCVAATTSTTPSFSSMLTGCYPPKHGVRGLQGYRLSPAVTTLAEALGGAGYHTYAEVTGPLLPETGILRGFAEANHRPGYRAPFMGWRDATIERMRSYEEPWFMLLHLWEVHRPYRPPPDHVKRWDRAGYEAVVEAVDAQLEPVFDTLPENTIVVITGDHGEDYPRSRLELKLIRVAGRLRRALKLSRWFPSFDGKLAQLAVGHGFALFEQLVRVPLVIAGPGVVPVAVSDQVRHIDLFPTLAGLCNVPVPEGIDGRDLRALMEGRSLPEEPAYMEAVGVKLEGRRIEGARTSDWKLVRPPRSRPALYKLNGGTERGLPDEKRDVSSRYPEIARSLEMFLDRVAADETVSSGMSGEEEALVEEHLRDLGYL